MPASFVDLNSADDFSAGFYIEWAERPPDFPPQPIVPIAAYDDALCVYDFVDQKVTIDVQGSPVSLTACDPNLLVGAFRPGDSVIFGKTDASAMPVHLRFDPPVRAIGTRVAAIAAPGVPYVATLNARDAASGSWMHRSVNATVSRNDESAPFVGLRCKAGGAIDEVWFDVISANGAALDAVAINQLFYLPR
jgi:hypothetical protein